MSESGIIMPGQYVNNMTGYGLILPGYDIIISGYNGQHHIQTCYCHHIPTCYCQEMVF